MTKDVVPYAAGVDGGGSKTLAVVVDAQGQERGRGLANSANYNTVGLEQAISNIRGAIEQAALAAGCSLPLRAVWLGLAGVDRVRDHALFSPRLQSLAATIHLTNDAELVLSALDHAVGVALIAGTGSIALGRGARGKVTRAGGWGYILGDEGSGYEIGRRSLQAAVRAFDGRDSATSLLPLILSHWQLQKANDLIGKVYGDNNKALIAALSTLAFNAARAGDAVATGIVQQAASELALAALTVSDVINAPGEGMSLAMGGGLLLHEADFRARVLDGIRQSRPIEQVVLVEDPALSAARAALSLAQSTV